MELIEDDSGERVRILRPGVIGAHAIADVLGEAVDDHGSVVEAAGDAAREVADELRGLAGAAWPGPPGS